MKPLIILTLLLAACATTEPLAQPPQRILTRQERYNRDVELCRQVSLMNSCFPGLHDEGGHCFDRQFERERVWHQCMVHYGWAERVKLVSPG